MTKARAITESEDNEFLTALDETLLHGMGFRSMVFGGSLWKTTSSGDTYCCVTDEPGEYLKFYKIQPKGHLGESFYVPRAQLEIFT